MAHTQVIVSECSAPTKRVKVRTFRARRPSGASHPTSDDDARASLTRGPRSASDSALSVPASPSVAIVSVDDDIYSECATPTQRVRIHTFPVRRRTQKRDAATHARTPSPTHASTTHFSTSPGSRQQVVLFEDATTVAATRKRASASFYNKMCPTQARRAPVTLIDESRLPFLHTSPRNQTLVAYLKQTDATTDVTWQKLMEAAESLQQLHGQGIVHGRLQCCNILLTADATQRAHVRNFTTSSKSCRWMDDDDDAVRWLAPECLDDSDDGTITRPQTTQTDVFALGMCILEAVTRTAPWGAVSASVVRVLTLAGRLPTRPATATLHDDAWSLIERMCTKDPARRATIDVVVAALRDFADRALVARVALERNVPRVLYSD